MTINTRKHTSPIHRRMFTVAAAAFVLLIAVNSSFAQDRQTPSRDRDNPTPLTSAEIESDGVDEKTEYFFSFTAGPGEVKLTLDVKAEKDSAVSSVDIALFDANSRKLLSTYANPDHGSSKRAVETVKVRGEQTLLLDVTISPGVDNFKIKLDGAVTIKSGTGPSIEPTGPAIEPTGPDPSRTIGQPPLSMSISTDQNNPTPLAAHVINGASVEEKTKYFCTFVAGPGQVTLKLNVKSKKEAAVSSVDIELLDSDSKHLVSGFANPSLGDSKQQTLTANLDSKQKVVLTITVSTGVDKYSLGVTGAVEVQEAASLRSVIDLRPITVATLGISAFKYADRAFLARINRSDEVKESGESNNDRFDIPK